MERRLHVGLSCGVRDEHQAGVVAEPFLLGSADRHIVLREHAGDGVEHAGPVDDLEGDVVLGARLVDRTDAASVERPDRRMRSLAQVARGVDEVAEHRARRRPAARAPAVEHERRRRRRPRRTPRCSCLGRWPADGDAGTIAGCTRTATAPSSNRSAMAEQLHDVAEARRATSMSSAVMLADALVVDVAGDHATPNAIDAMIAAFAPASNPSTSAVGHARRTRGSAPRRARRRSTAPASVIRVRM